MPQPKDTTGSHSNVPMRGDWVWPAPSKGYITWTYETRTIAH